MTTPLEMPAPADAEEPFHLSPRPFLEPSWPPDDDEPA